MRCVAAALVAIAAAAAGCGSGSSSTTDNAERGHKAPPVASSGGPLVELVADGVPLPVTAIDATVTVQGPLARTELKVAFANTLSKPRTGKLAVHLPDTAGLVSGPGANGTSHDVEIFATPALDLTIAYVEELPTGAYALPLGGMPGPIGRLDVAVTAITRDGLSTTTHQHETAWQPRDLTPALPQAMGLTIGDGEDIVARIDAVPALAEDAPKPGERLHILVDTSASHARGEVVLADTHALLATLRARFGDALELDVTAFDQSVAKVYEGPIAGWGAAQDAILAARGAAGATDLAAALGSLSGGRVILLGDAIPTIGTSVPPKLDAFDRIDVLKDDPSEDGIADELALAGKRAGIVVAEERDIATAGSRLGRVADSIVVANPKHADVWPEHLAEVEAAGGGKPQLVYITLPGGTANTGLTLSIAGRAQQFGPVVQGGGALIQTAKGLRSHDRFGDLPMMAGGAHHERRMRRWRIASVDGVGIDKEAVRKLVDHVARPGLDACNAAARETVDIKVAFAVAPTGAVKDVRATGGGATLGACATRAIAALVFPVASATAGGTTAGSGAAKSLAVVVALHFEGTTFSAANAPALTGEAADIAAAIASGKLDRAVELAHAWYEHEAWEGSALAYGDALMAAKRDDDARRVFGGLVELGYEERVVAGWSLARTGAAGRKLALEVLAREVAQQRGFAGGEVATLGVRRLVAMIQDRDGDHAGAVGTLLDGVTDATKLPADVADEVRLYAANGGGVVPDLKGLRPATAPMTRVVLAWAHDGTIELGAPAGATIVQAPAGAMAKRMDPSLTTATLASTASGHVTIRFVASQRTESVPGLVTIEHFDGKSTTYEDRPFVTTVPGALVDLGPVR